MLPTSADLLPYLPEITLVVTILLVLLVPVLSPKKNILAVAVTAAAGLGAALVACVPTYLVAMEAPGRHFHGMLLLDPFAWSVKLLILLFTLIVMALWFTDSHDKFLLRGQAGDAPEFFVLLLSATLGLCLMASTDNLLMIFVSIELASLPSYVLAGFRKNHRAGAEAAMKYVLFGGGAAAIMLYGISLIYGFSHTFTLHELAVIPAHALPDPLHLPASASTQPTSVAPLFVLAVLGLVVGIGFKIAMVPMHFWCPDVFEGAPIDVTTFLSVASKAAGLALLMRVVLIFGESEVGHWLPGVILFLGAITCFWGNLAAYPQRNIKRLLAWSSVAHAGYMLIAISALAPMGASWYAVTTNPATEALLFYLLMYLFMNAGAFITAAAIAQRLAGPNTPGMSLGVERILLPASSTAAPGISGEEIADYTGLSRRAPILAATMLVFLLSLIGIPLTIGFGTKVKLAALLFNATPWMGALAWVGLGTVGINMVIGAFYYFRVIRQMYLRESEAARLIEIAPVSILALVLVVPNVALFVAYGPVEGMVHGHAGTLAPEVKELRRGMAGGEEKRGVGLEASVVMRGTKPMGGAALQGVEHQSVAP